MSEPVRCFLFLLSSTRRLGNTEQLAYCAADALPQHTPQRWMHLLDYPLPNFVDLRHDVDYQPPVGNAQVLLDATLEATDLVLVAPLYWYSLPFLAKHYLDHWSAWLRTPTVDFRAQMRGKTLWTIVASSGERAEANPLEDTLKRTAQYMQMPWGGMLFGTGSSPNDIQGDAGALLSAKTFFRNSTPEQVPLQHSGALKQTTR